MSVKSLFLISLVIFINMNNPAAMAQMDCENLTNVHFNNTIIKTAETANAQTMHVETMNGKGAFVQVPDICRVTGVIAPAINFEVWLPLHKGWNGRYLAAGNGGLAGIINFRYMADSVNDGYATSSTDTGHDMKDEKWFSDRGRVIDYGYRAIHKTTVQAKAIIAAYYGKSQDYSYFSSCSNGGRQGLMEAQRYPDDFDGIISGAPAYSLTAAVSHSIWNHHATLSSSAKLSSDDLSLLASAVLDSCDTDDGVKDGLITDPRSCHFDPIILQCKTPNQKQCLSIEQVNAVKKVYQGVTNPRTGDRISHGTERGSEGDMRASWMELIMNDDRIDFLNKVVNEMILKSGYYKWQDFDFDEDLDILNKKASGTLNAANPDLRDYEKNGGKLILYHGWSDVSLSPRNTIDYYEDMIAYRKKYLGSSNAHEEITNYARLYMMPGVSHCYGGAGPDKVDFVSAIKNWVERGIAPKDLIATKYDDDKKEIMTRPICPYPQIAVYEGKGDTNKASNFKCKEQY